MITKTSKPSWSNAKMPPLFPIPILTVPSQSIIILIAIFWFIHWVMSPLHQKPHKLVSATPAPGKTAVVSSYRTPPYAMVDSTDCNLDFKMIR